MEVKEPSPCPAPHLDMEVGQGDVGSACGASKLELLVRQGLDIPLLPWGSDAQPHLTLLESCAAQPNVALWLDQVGLKGNVPGVLPKAKPWVL